MPGYKLGIPTTCLQAITIYYIFLSYYIGYLSSYDSIQINFTFI